MANFLPKHKADKIIEAFQSGMSTREIAKAFRVSKGAAERYRKRATLPALCRCGQTYGHRGWCTHRYQRSLLRQFTLHPEKFQPILNRLTELWVRMPEDLKLHALRQSDGRFFNELTIKTKLALLECGWAWIQYELEQEKVQEEYQEEMKWLRESRKLMKQVKELVRAKIYLAHQAFLGAKNEPN